METTAYIVELMLGMIIDQGYTDAEIAKMITSRKVRKILKILREP